MGENAPTLLTKVNSFDSKEVLRILFCILKELRKANWIIYQGYG